MNLLRALLIGERKGRIADTMALAGAVDAGAAYLAQGASYAYLRARSGMVAPRLMEDSGFGAAVERCKWEGFAAAAGDLTLILEGDLRAHMAADAPTPAAFWDELYRGVLEAHPVPPHRAGEGWDDRLAEFARRLEIHLAWPPRGIEAIADHSANVIMEYAPVDDSIREVDREMVVNNVKLRFIDQVTELRRRIDWPLLAADVAAQTDA